MMNEIFRKFHSGKLEYAYEILGAHQYIQNGEVGYIFRVWAPTAKNVYVGGDFNCWNTNYQMKRITKEGLWEIFIADIQEYDNYKYIIESREGKLIYKADPYGFHTELRPNTASKIYNIDNYIWQDEEWCRQRNNRNPYQSPMNIYEVHLGSWRKYGDGNFFNYEKLAEELIPYVKEMGYTHLEIMPISEYPYDASWGYQVSGYFSITSRYGTPKEFMKFIDKCHQSGIGVIMDWVPGHFPKDEAGLYMFDGIPCYEYADPLKREHKAWGTMVFDWGKNEVKSFLISNAVFWYELFHIDGLRVDAVASMLYLDYNRSKGAWRANIYGGNENLEAANFLKELNVLIFSKYPYALMIAEESTAWPMVTKPVYLGGLGFNFKWNMGWMNDTLTYMKQDSLFRGGCHNHLTFAMTYIFSENFILPLSHDEVVHMKGSLSNKMPGDYENKLANLRAYIGYMMCHPGKKLTFMGCELAQFSEWDYAKELDWYLLETKQHKQFHNFIKDLNHIYLKQRELWERDDNWEGFKWINADDSENNMFSFRRFDKEGNELLIVSNFSPFFYSKYLLPISEKGRYRLIFSSSEKQYGGNNNCKKWAITKSRPYRNEEYSLDLSIPEFSTSIWKKIKEVK